jgi:alkanesulfonate monooxygenase SsuD/methylene tetrahydromethanopterin reductase-like flavin-dependent oxidoreductase (luciferase family)
MPRSTGAQQVRQEQEQAPVPDAVAPLEVGLGFWSMQSTYMRPIPRPQVYSEAVSEARLVERLGFDTLWMGEHHMSYDGYCPSLFPPAAALLSATSRLRIASGVMVLPLHTARRVAEGSAALASLAPGRFRLAVGIGYRPVEFAAAGVRLSDRAKLTDERLDELRGPELSERTGATDLWVGTGVSGGVARAARFGASVLLMPTVSSRKVAGLRQQWSDGLVAAAGGPTPRLGVMRECWVDTDPRMVDWARGRLIEMWRHYSNFWVDDPVAQRARRDELAEQMGGQSLFGSPDEVVDRLGRLIEAGADTVALRVRFDGVSGGALRRCLRLIAERVLPQLARPVVEVAS